MALISDHERPSPHREKRDITIKNPSETKSTKNGDGDSKNPVNRGVDRKIFEI